MTLAAGDVGGVVLETGARDGPALVPPDEIMRLFEQTRDFWRELDRPLPVPGRWRETVERSAMTLKLLTYAPTGALVAAPTAGLPEQIGGERNWDYRYTWIRDASFSVHALLGLGFTDEAQAFLRWLQRPGPRRGRAVGSRCRSCTGSTGRPTWTRRSSTTSRGTGARPRCGSATAPPTSSSSTSTARRWTPCHLADTHGMPMSHEGWRNAAS